MTDTTASYVCGTSDVPLLFKTVGQAFDETAAIYADREAIVACHQNIRWTYSELKAAVDACAAGLIALGLKPGDRIGIWSPNNVEWVVTQFATAKAGLILVNINPAYRLSELEYALNLSGCRALILADQFKSSDYVNMVQTLAPEINNCTPCALKAEKLPGLEMVMVISDTTPNGFLNFKDIAAHATSGSKARMDELSSILQPDDPINIQFTSGTTGSPKGATLTHHNIVNNGFFVAERQHFTEQDKLCIPVPLYHCFGMVMGVLGCITHGACIVLPSDAFDPATTLKAVADENCTALYGVPTMFIAQLEDPSFSNYEFPHLRTGAMAGSPCPVEVMKQVISDMNLRDMTIAYGMTETSPVSLQTSPDAPLDKRVETVGTVHPFVEVKIIGSDGRCLPRGEQGELVTRGYSVMLGYWADEERTDEAIDSGGWMHTGDLAVMAEDGYVSITGRLKDMIIRGGENIYPREIEEFLYSHPDISDAQVFGVPDPKFGEQVAVWIKLKPNATLTEDTLKAFCKGQIAHYKIPTYVKFVEAFPMTVTGKIQKFVMREETEKAFGT